MTDKKGIRGNVRTLKIDEFNELLKNRGSDSGKSKSGKKQDGRRIFSEVFKEEKVINSLLNEEYRELFDLVEAFKKYYDIRGDNPDEKFRSIGSFLDYSGTSNNAGKKYRATHFLDNLFSSMPNDKEQVQGILLNYGLGTKNRQLQDKFKIQDEELDKVVSELTKTINRETLETMGEKPEADVVEESKEELLDDTQEEEEGLPEKIEEEEQLRELAKRGKVVEEEEEEEQKEGDTLKKLLEEEEQEPTPTKEPAQPPSKDEGTQTDPPPTASTSTSTSTSQPPDQPPEPVTQVDNGGSEQDKKPQSRRTETISNPVGQNLIDQIPKEMISTQFKNIEELEEEIQFLLDKFPRLLMREREIYREIDVEDIDQLRRLHKTIIGKLGADKQREKIAVVIPAEDYIKAEVNKILLETALKNMRAEDIIQTINMPNRQGETDGLTVGDFVVREGNTSGLQNQGQPIYRYIPTTNQEVEEQQGRTGKIRLNITKRTRLNVAKREFRNDPFIFRRPQPIRLKYLG